MKTHGMKMRNDGKKKERTTKAAIMGLIAAVYLSAPAPGEDLGSTYGGKVTDGDANGFTATLDGDYRVNGVLIGGSSDNGNANDNAVDAKGKLELNGSLYGGYAPKGVANGNTVTLEGDMDLNVALYGGWGDKEANNNSVILKGDITINEDLFGAITSTGTANGNLVSLEGNITIVGNLRGGRSGSGLSSDNTLEIRSENIRVGGLYNFQNLNYYFSGTVKDGTIMVWVTDKANISGSTIQLFFSGEDGGLQPGEKIILIQTVYGITGIPANKDSQVTARVGVSLDYGQYDLTFDDPKNPKKLIASLHQEEDPDPDPQPDPEPAPDPSPTPDPDPDPTPSPEPNPTPASPTPVVPKVNPQLKSLLEGWLAGMTQLVRGGDLVAEAIDDAATAGSSENMAGGIPFAKINGNRLRHKTGSHIDTRGTNVVAGIAGGKSGEDGSALTGGVFLEYGRGNYDTWNTFADRDPVQGAGDTKYAGAGAMGRYDFKSKTDAHTYFEGSLRGGRIKVNYDSLTLKDAMGTVAAWHAETGYMSAHGAVGRTIKLSGAATLDVKAGYYWTRMNGAETRLTTGEKITYEEIDSHRARIAARLTGDSKLAVKPYAGIALEREFSGKARGSVYGYKIDPPTLKGTTFVADAGIQIKAGNKDNLTIELGVQAYAGRREGITGGAGFSYKF